MLLKKPVYFEQLGSVNLHIQVNDVFLLILDNSFPHINSLFVNQYNLHIITIEINTYNGPEVLSFLCKLSVQPTNAADLSLNRHIHHSQWLFFEIV